MIFQAFSIKTPVFPTSGLHNRHSFGPPPAPPGMNEISKKHGERLCFLEIFVNYVKNELKKHRFCGTLFTNKCRADGILFLPTHIHDNGRGGTMCSNTKQRIGTALRQLMNERPFDKITVQNLMDATNMKRQSFYYHFRDTRDVLLWICRQELVEPLRSSELDYVDWALYALELVEQDRVFYRRVLNAAHPAFVREIGAQVLWPRIARLIYGSAVQAGLDANQRFVVDFFVHAALEQYLRFISSRVPLDRRVARQRIGCLLATVQFGRGG